jgi:hypothetical protein
MTAEAMPPEAPPYERMLLTSRKEYHLAADRVISLAYQELRFFDPDLSDFRLETPERILSLRAFLARSRDNRVKIAVHDPEYVKRHCPRLISLLGSYAGFIAVHRTQGDAAKAQDCFILADRLHVVRRAVAKQPRGVLLVSDPLEGHGMHSRFSEIWESSEPGASASTSGL